MKLTGTFDKFKDLDKIPLENINRWLKIKVEPHFLYNFLANRIQFPQTVAMDHEELEIDLAILREAVLRQPGVFYDTNLKKVLISKEDASRFPPLFKLVTALMDTLPIDGVATVFLRDSADKKQVDIVGSIFVPTFVHKEKSLKLQIDNQVKELPIGSITQIPIRGNVHMKIDEKTEIEVGGGDLGLVVDLRKLKT